MASEEIRRWRGWTRVFGLTALGVIAALFGFIAALDPYGARVQAGQSARPLMDLNQRFMYPQLVRSGAFDSAILGTSTLRLLDPAILSQGLQTHLVNLGMNAATPWEQVQIATLFARKTAAPKYVIWGIDPLWCDADATEEEKRLTPRPFPPWLYDDATWNDWAKQLNFTTLEIAVRLAGHRLGLVPPRIRGDGYEVFTPPEASYDLARARFHLYRHTDGKVLDLAPLSPPEFVAAEQRAAWRFPALAWLDQALAAFPQQTRRILVLPPIHGATLPREGTAGFERQQACKAQIAAIAARHGAIIADYAHVSPLTREDTNYWDPLHYRLPIARRIEADLIALGRGEKPPADPALQVVEPIR
ncbi:MAG TPA: hypothetical protein VGO06_08905 [Bosea sp. (in: a-proteobacteria)]|jgi:hypothetical protein|uniref:hypothetical protein n=1 Tax=Bosea sp. (in: a-proteobacteria) TaxID=1871050 RepID=UPI002E0E08D2|nr:hypothetical protein [Bosea sp. (in: a-proteobacteria)]